MFCVITRTGTPDRSSSATARWAAFGSGFRRTASRRISHERRRIAGSDMEKPYVTSFSASGPVRHTPLGPR